MMPSLKSLAAYTFAGMNMLFASGCTVEQQAAIDNLDMQYKAWNMLDDYQYVDNGLMKKYVSAYYTDILARADTISADSLQENQENRLIWDKNYIVDGDTLRTRLFYDDGGFITALYNLSEERSAEIVFSDFTDKSGYPQHIIKREETILSPAVYLIDEKTMYSNVDSLKYGIDIQSSMFFARDPADSTVEHSILADAAIIQNMGEPRQRRVSLNYYLHDQVSCATLDNDGLKVIINDDQPAEDAVYQKISDVNTGSFDQFLKETKQAVRHMTGEKETHRALDRKMKFYFNQLEQDDKARQDASFKQTSWTVK